MQGILGTQRVCRSVLLQVGLLRRIAGSAGCVSAAVPRLGDCYQPEGLQPLPSLQRQGC